MSTPENPIPVLLMKPEEAQVYLHLAEPDARLNLGITQYNRETGEGTIIINANLPPLIRQVIHEHEQVQCLMIQKYVSNHPERHMEDILPYAHFAGLNAGVELAKQLGVLEDYLEIRGLGETEESIRPAPRP
jgi:hypothetical protein